MRVKRLTENEINYNVLNGLNLYSEELGQEYLAKGINPLGENFILTEAYILERLANKMHLQKETIAPEFINAGVKQTRLAFLNSLTNCKALLEKLEELLNDPHIPESEKEKLRKLKLYLLLRIQLLTKYTKTIKKDKNTLNMYENVEMLDDRLAKVLKVTYTQVDPFSFEDFMQMIKESLVAMDELGKLVDKQTKVLQNSAKNLVLDGAETIKETIKDSKEFIKESARQIEKVVTAPIDAIKDAIKEPEPVKEAYVSTTKVSVKKTIVAETVEPKPKTKKQTTKQNDGLSR